MGTFFFSFLLLLWIYFGVPNWVPIRKGGSSTVSGPMDQRCPNASQFNDPACDTYAANGWETPVIITDKGQTLVTCLNPYDSAQQLEQNAIGYSVAVSASVTTVADVIFAICAFCYIKHQFRGMQRVVEKQRSLQPEAAQQLSQPLPQL